LYFLDSACNKSGNAIKTVKAPKKNSAYANHSGSSVTIYSILGLECVSNILVSLIGDYNSA
jgi:hypothetical protein